MGRMELRSDTNKARGRSKRGFLGEKNVFEMEMCLVKIIEKGGTRLVQE